MECRRGYAVCDDSLLYTDCQHSQNIELESTDVIKWVAVHVMDPKNKYIKASLISLYLNMFIS
jgi:hypothetical protein